MLPPGACVLPEAMEGVSSHHTPKCFFFFNKGKKLTAPTLVLLPSRMGPWQLETWPFSLHLFPHR